MEFLQWMIVENPWITAMAILWLPWPTALAIYGVADSAARLVAYVIEVLLMALSSKS